MIDNKTILIFIVGILILGTLYLVRCDNTEPFVSNEYLKKKLRINNDNIEKTYDKENNQINSGIIMKGGLKDNYQSSNDLQIEIPLVPNKKIDPEAAFQTNQYIRDTGVNTAIKKLETKDEIEYHEVAQAYTDFVLPKDSNNELLHKKITDFTKEELDNSTLQDIYDKMTTSNSKKLSQEEIDRISGKPIINTKLSGLYKPVYISYDSDFNKGDNIDVDYKYEGYSNLPYGSLI